MFTLIMYTLIKVKKKWSSKSKLWHKRLRAWILLNGPVLWCTARTNSQIGLNYYTSETCHHGLVPPLWGFYAAFRRALRLFQTRANPRCTRSHPKGRSSIPVQRPPLLSSTHLEPANSLIHLKHTKKKTHQQIDPTERRPLWTSVFHHETVFS